MEQVRLPMVIRQAATHPRKLSEPFVLAETA
ncbi:hypothetical protein JOF55_000299 [Haloactinomyces albus]|uniref:Uncharacterized protein n=1 Tax=Haloactinomyces albus TaxID=1352928 RepID=A0AAE4CMZ2_9ACTN|nr:hypothetical protein [Haloactinomyces albus]